nr:unnamed protein product [Digitaria exilis]
METRSDSHCHLLRATARRNPVPGVWRHPPRPPQGHQVPPVRGSRAVDAIRPLKRGVLTPGGAFAIMSIDNDDEEAVEEEGVTAAHHYDDDVAAAGFILPPPALDDPAAADANSINYDK